MCHAGLQQFDNRGAGRLVITREPLFPKLLDELRLFAGRELLHCRELFEDYGLKVWPQCIVCKPRLERTLSSVVAQFEFKITSQPEGA